MKKQTLLVLAPLVIASFCKAQNPALWGLTSVKGTNSWGVIFNYNSYTESENIVHDFGSSTDGADPGGSPILATNKLIYGLTFSGGTNNKGIIFSSDASTGTETDLHDFGTAGTDGYYPNASLIQAGNGLLYGMTGDGGIYGGGTIFSYNISSGVESVIYNFGSSSDGYLPDGSLMQASNGLLYGVTTGGGTNSEGVIFSFNISNGKETVIHNFSNGEKLTESTLMQASDSLLYGITRFGGLNNNGIIFSYNISNGSYSDLHDFGTGNDGNTCLMGKLLQAKDGLLYGITCYGGANDKGVIFSYNIATGIETALYNFGMGTDGSYSYGSLIQASNGLLYGMTDGGGINNRGMIFSYDISTATENDLHDFGSSNDGESPYGDLIEYDPVFATGSLICNGSSATLTAGGATTYTWTPATGLSATTGDSVMANPSVTTVYSITGTGLGGWSATTTDTAKVVIAPALIIQPQSPSVCSGQSITLSVPVTGSNYVWSPSSTLSSSTADSVIATPKAITTYTVSGIDSLGCLISDSDVVTVILPPDKPTISLSTNGDTLISSATQGNQWYFNDTIISGATNQVLVITAQKLGSYIVTVINPANGCSATSDSFMVSGINRLSFNNTNFSIYPNPSSGQFTIKLDGNQNGYTLEVYNVVGELAYISVLGNSKNVVNLNTQPPGIYFVYLKSKESIEVGKVLIAK